MSLMPRLETFACRTAFVICGLAILSLVSTLFLPTKDFGVPGSLVGMILIVAVCVMHAIATKGVKEALSFLVIAAVITWFFEYIGCNYGWWFGEYEYTERLGISLGNVPLVVVIAWEGIIYPSMILVDDLLGRPALTTRGKHLLHITLASLATGLVVTAWDFLADPVAVAKRFWKWDHGGGYALHLDGGIPLSNYGLTGWVGAVFIISFLYRILYTSEQSVIVPSRQSVLFAAALYTAWFCNAAYGLLHEATGDPGYHEPLMVGTFLMGTVLLLVWTRLLTGFTGDFSAADHPADTCQSPRQSSQ